MNVGLLILITGIGWAASTIWVIFLAINAPEYPDDTPDARPLDHSWHRDDS